MRPAFELTELVAHALTTVDGQHMKAGQMMGIALERFGDLNGQLTGGRQHQRLRSPLGQIQFLQDRQGKGGSLAGAGLRLAQQVVAVQQVRNGGRLNRRRGFVAEFLQSLQQRRGKRQLFE